MKNVAILITKLSGGGAERAAANLSIELSEFYKTKIIVFDGENQTYPHGGELIDLKLPPRNSLIGKVSNVLKRVLAVRKIKKQHNIYCTISFMDGPNLVNVLSKYNDKVIISIRIFMTLSRKRNIFFTKLKTKFILNRADKVVSVAKAIEFDLIDNFGAKKSKSLTINNYCDGKRLMELAAQTDTNDIISFEEDCKYIVTAGRLTNQKGQWHLIRAFKKVLCTVPNSKLIILGEGEYKDRLIQLAKDLKIDDKVILTGYVNNPHKVISKCHVFAFPSLFEGFSNALLEALACKMAIVSTDCDSGSREIIAPNTPFEKKTDNLEYAEYGIITPVCDSGHFNAEEPLTNQEGILAKALCEMLKNDSLRNFYAEKAQERVKDFSPEIINGQWNALIEQITSDCSGE